MLKKINNIITNTANTLRAVLEQTTLETTSQTNNVLARSGGVRKSTTTSTTKIVLPARKPAPTKQWESIHKPEGWKFIFPRNRRGEDKEIWTDRNWEDLSYVPVIIDKYGNSHKGFRTYNTCWKDNLHTSFDCWEDDLVRQAVVWGITKNDPAVYLIKWDAHMYGWLMENIHTDLGQEIVREINRFIDKMNRIIKTLVDHQKIDQDFWKQREASMKTVNDELFETRQKLYESDMALASIKDVMKLAPETAISDIAGTLESMFERGIRPGDITEKTEDIVEEDTPHGRYLMEKRNADSADDDEDLEW